MTDCCLCGWQGGGMQALALHLAERHEDFEPDRQANYITCVCNYGFRLTAAHKAGPEPLLTLAEHLEESGGLATHLLEVALGLEG